MTEVRDDETAQKSDEGAETKQPGTPKVQMQLDPSSQDSQRSTPLGLAKAVQVALARCDGDQKAGRLPAGQLEQEAIRLVDLLQ